MVTQDVSQLFLQQTCPSKQSSRILIPEFAQCVCKLAKFVKLPITTSNFSVPRRKVLRNLAYVNSAVYYDFSLHLRGLTTAEYNSV